MLHFWKWSFFQELGIFTTYVLWLHPLQTTGMSGEICPAASALTWAEEAVIKDERRGKVLFVHPVFSHVFRSKKEFWVCRSALQYKASACSSNMWRWFQITGRPVHVMHSQRPQPLKSCLSAVFYFTFCMDYFGLRVWVHPFTSQRRFFSGPPNWRCSLFWDKTGSV